MSGFFVQNAWLIPFLPILGAAVAAFGARRLRFDAHIPVIAGIALAFLILFLSLLSTSGRLARTRAEVEQLRMEQSTKEAAMPADEGQ